MLRAATLEDTTAVARVLLESRRAFLPYAPSPRPPNEVLDWVAHHLIPAGGVTVAVNEGEVVAMLAVSEDDSAAWVDQLYVLPGFDNQGLGSRLLRFAHESLKRPVRLFTFQQNTGARRFYERHGYKVVALSDGQSNEEKCPDVLYEFGAYTEA
jgi:ribosomal protein S18 acetylase RimI-like enzyme